MHTKVSLISLSLFLSLELFHCSDGQTIRQSWVCDNRQDCDDSSDEWNCSECVYMYMKGDATLKWSLLSRSNDASQSACFVCVCVCVFSHNF